MKVFILFICSVLVCLDGATANVGAPREHVSGLKVASIHRRISSVPSNGNNAPKSLESRPVGTIERTIQSLHRDRRDVAPVDYERIRKGEKTTTSYPKHHLIQPIELPLGEFMPEEDLDSTTAPFTENHHSWKRTRVLVK